ncbi:hypothetical protein [Streptomyces fagopyri]|uniref:hypothetical protein n=1 Tax=Streptomyces fagopyri TaxID=2662397 RepID=UPI00381B2677
MVLESDGPGFHHSVLADFRERLGQDGRADRILDLTRADMGGVGALRGALAHEAGFLQAGGRRA